MQPRNCQDADRALQARAHSSAMHTLAAPSCGLKKWRTMPPYTSMASPLFLLSAILRIRSEIPIELAKSSSLRCVRCSKGSVFGICSDLSKRAQHVRIVSGNRATAQAVQLPVKKQATAHLPCCRGAAALVFGGSSRSLHLEGLSSCTHARKDTGSLIEHLFYSPIRLPHVLQHPPIPVDVRSARASPSHERSPLGILLFLPASPTRHNDGNWPYAPIVREST